MKIIIPEVTLQWITPDSERQIELAGRTCYKSEDRISENSSREFVERMRNVGHLSMIEHAAASFKIITDRGISHEIVRHRLASFAQESTRYCNYSKDKFGSECSFIEPPGMDAVQRKEWEDACIYAESKYFSLLKSGCQPQIARSVLPNCLKTEIVMMANFREWRHFISLRGAPIAHPQIRPIAHDIWMILMKHAPSVFEDLKPDNI